MEVMALGRVLWDYLRIGASVDRCEAIVAFGGHDLRVAEWAAQLWLDAWAPTLVLSGGLGYYTGKIWKEPEAQKFRRIAIERGVNADAILIEDQSTNSGENISFTRRLCENNGLSLSRAICVQKPYLERRVQLTLQKQWPDCDFLLSSPPVPYERYAQPGIIDSEKLLNEMVGQVDRIEKYPELGFTERSGVPDEVLSAKRQLIELGYAKHLISEGLAGRATPSADR
jgi:uncharacterized SAM-binding protein YcdF (DUF218 family)